MNQPRTIREFVEDMVSDGRDLKQILIVAANIVRWRNSKEEIKKEYCRLVN